MNFGPLTLASLALSLAGCSSPTTGPAWDGGPAFKDGGGVAPPAALPAEVALIWTVFPGNNAGTCALDDTFTIGNPEGAAAPTVQNGGSSLGFPIAVTCTVSPDAAGYSVSADVAYGTAGTLRISGQIDVTPGSSPTVANGIQGVFYDHIRPEVTKTLTDTNCAMTFTSNPKMGIAAGRIWGDIDCSRATAPDGTVCAGRAELLLLNCGK